MATKQKVVILGATGSIGESTLEVLRQNRDDFTLFGVSGFNNLQKLQAICLEFCPAFVAISDHHADEMATFLKTHYLASTLLVGETGLIKLACLKEAQTVVGAVVGAAGLAPIFASVCAGKRVLLANKEALVMAGELLLATAERTGASILPIDSEHNAIFQCLPVSVQTNAKAIHDPNLGIKKLWLTASGGAFLHHTLDEMANATPKEAINHPNWSMGAKISVDSATMMNKGLEVIEACVLFGMPVDSVAVVIHPQSVVHSMVQYIDGSFLAQLGASDMKTPIAHALAYPKRVTSGTVSLDPLSLSDLQFFAPDTQKFACLALAIQAMRLGMGARVVLNAVNELAVQAFLDEKIRLTDIAVVLADALADERLLDVLGMRLTTLDEVMAVDAKARQIGAVLIQQREGV